jgi:excinuclease ABC subunit C
VRLRDDKNYPYLQLTTNEDFPRVLVARRVERDGTFYAGPFMPASLARRTMGLTHRLFGIRSCNEVITGMRERPCLEYDIKRCIAPCVMAICSREQYDEAVQRTRLFFEGKNEELIDRLTTSMTEAAEGERFEEAAHLRDATRTVQTLRDRQQKIATARLGDRDAFGIHMGPAGAVVHVFVMREGKVLERIELAANEGISGSAAEIVQASVEQFYESRPAPAEVHLSSAPEDADLLEAWLSDRAGRKVEVVVPKRGEKRGLVDLAVRNARVAYQARLIDTGLSNYDALETLRATLQLPAIPRRIECFDISTIQGSETVAAMVVCEDGKMRKSEYRKYRISPANHAGSDDFAAMHEVVQRRYRKVLEQGGPFPDLILIDGGKGQLSAAYDALRELGLANLVAVGIAKKEELIYTRDRDQPIAFAKDDPALQLVQRIRDEAHRFAVTFHRKARQMRDLRSELDSVPGIGPRRRRALLVAFGSLAGVRRASREDLMALVGAKTADAVLGYFAGK